MSAAVLKAIGVAVILSALAPATGIAADIAPPESPSDWTFTGAAYLWGAGISGKSGVFGLPPQDVDMSFGDILEDLNFAFMGLGEARNGRFVLGGDLTYSKVSSSYETPRGILADKIDVTSTSWMVTGFGGYSIFENDTVRFDVIGGGRYWSTNTEFKVDSKHQILDGRTAEDGASWVDPLVGIKTRVDLTPDIYLSAWAMIGGFGVGSDLMWDLMAGAGYEFNDNWSAFAGYRAVSVDYSNDGFVYDVVQQGPALAAVFHF